MNPPAYPEQEKRNGGPESGPSSAPTPEALLDLANRLAREVKEEGSMDALHAYGLLVEYMGRHQTPHPQQAPLTWRQAERIVREK